MTKPGNLPKTQFFLRKSWNIGDKPIATFTRDSKDESGILMEIQNFSYLQAY